MNKGRHGGDHTLLIFVLAVFLFNSPLNIWWSSMALPWYAMFVPWLLIVLLLALNQLRHDHGD
ncbi:MAG: hypothetical protein AB8B87_21305 [Granulosicoccus sp.]